VGRLTVFGLAHKNCFGKQTPNKGRFFHSIAIFWDCFFNPVILPGWAQD
jgi:hypothetical protein